MAVMQNRRVRATSTNTCVALMSAAPNLRQALEELEVKIRRRISQTKLTL